MTRRRRIALLLLALVSLIGLAGWSLVRISSSPELIAHTMGAILGRPVEVGSVELRAGRRLSAELRDVRILDGPAREPLLSVERVLAEMDWPRLLAGHFVPESWTFVRPVVRLTGADGRKPLELPLLPIELKVQDGTLAWGDPSRVEYRLVHVEASARSRALPGALRGTALGQLERSGRVAAGYSVEFDAGSDHLRFRGSLSGLELGSLAAPGGWTLTGQASGTVSATLAPRTRTMSMDLELRGLAAEHPSLRSPIAPQEARLVAEASESEGVLEIGLRPLVLDDLGVRGTIRVHEGEDPRVEADLAFDEFRAGGPPERLQLLRLLGHRFVTFANTDARSEAGRIEARMRLDVPRSLLAQTLGFYRESAAREIALDARIRGGVYRHHPQGQPFEGIDAEVRIRGNRLEVYNLHMTRQGRPLPELDVTVHGLHRAFHLPAQERRVPVGPGEGIPGLDPALRALLQSKRPEEEGPASVILENLRVGHPAFVLPVRDATALLSFPGGNLEVEDLVGIVGGIPARARALWDRANSRVIVDLEYGNEGVPPREPQDSPWIESSARMDSAYIGPWRLEQLRMGLRAEGARVELSDIEAALAGGALRGEGEVDLSRDGEAPVHLDLALVEASAAGVVEALGVAPGSCEGTLAAKGSIEGPLSPDEPFLKRGKTLFDVAVKEGAMGNLPLTVTLARLATPLGWSGLLGRPLPFKSLDMRARTADGSLHVEDFQLEGPELRILAAGQIEVLSEERPVDLLVALLMFQSVDRVLKTVPLIGDWVLGKDRSLVAFYFRLEGPWANPDGRYVPPEALRAASGWAERMVVAGVRGLGRLLGPRQDSASP